MKKLSNVLENKEDINVKQSNVITLEGLDESEAQLLNNLNGMQIDECCNCRCCDTCCSTDIPDPIVWFYSESGIVDRLNEDIKIIDMMHLQKQFNQFKFMITTKNTNEPLFFTESTYNDVMAKLNLNNSNYKINESLYNYILELCNTYALVNPICLARLDNTLQLFFIKHTGTNGKEGSIKSSLSQIAKLLGELEKTDKITRSQVLDVAIDNCDDVYSFLITVTCDGSSFTTNLQ